MILSITFLAGFYFLKFCHRPEKFCFLFSPNLSGHSPSASLYLSSSQFVSKISISSKTYLSTFLFSFYAVPLSTFVHAFNYSPCGKHSDISISGLHISYHAPGSYIQLPSRHLQLANDTPHHSAHHMSQPELTTCPLHLLPLLFPLSVTRNLAVILVSHFF